MNDAHDRYIVNDALCWAAQAYIVDGVYDLSSAEARAQFAVTYIAINDNGSVERGEYGGIPGRGGGANGAFNGRIALDTVDDVCKEYFGKKLGAASLGAESAYQSLDGYLYFGTTAPFGQVARYAAATSVEKAEEGLYTVEFDVFEDGMPRIERDESFYGLTHDAMMAELGISSARVAGTASVKVVERKGVKEVELVSYSTSPAMSGEASGGLASEAEEPPAVPETLWCMAILKANPDPGSPADTVTGTYDGKTIALEGGMHVGKVREGIFNRPITGPQAWTFPVSDDFEAIGAGGGTRVNLDSERFAECLADGHNLAFYLEVVDGVAVSAIISS